MSNGLQHTASELQHIATNCKETSLQEEICHGRTIYRKINVEWTATHCNTLQHTATHCNRTATHCNALQHSATLCNTLQHPATPCKETYLQEKICHERTIYRKRDLEWTATPCNTLQHPTTPCNTLQHPATHEN